MDKAQSFTRFSKANWMIWGYPSRKLWIIFCGSPIFRKALYDKLHWYTIHNIYIYIFTHTIIKEMNYSKPPTWGSYMWCTIHNECFKVHIWEFVYTIYHIWSINTLCMVVCAWLLLHIYIYNIYIYTHTHAYLYCIVWWVICPCLLKSLLFD